jgi:phenylacetate-CoA ligase
MGQLLDIARGAYSKLSPQTRSRLGGLMQIVPTPLKYGGTYRQWRERIAAMRANPRLVRSHRDSARVALVAAAYTRSPYYRYLLRAVFGAGFRPEQVVHDEVWTRIPVLKPHTVAEFRDWMCTVPRGKLDPGSTGGTSGEPVKFYLDKNRSPIELAFVHDAWSRAGYRTGEPRCVMRGVEICSRNGGHVQYDASFAELRCSVFHLSDEVMRTYHDEIRARAIHYIHGYPSAMAIFASFLLRHGLAPMAQIRGVFPISERFYASYRDIIARAFDHAKIVPFYGLSEKVAFACERPGEDDTYDFEPLYGYTELLDENDAPITKCTQSGRIVSTGLLFRGMPLIRYETGDSAELAALPSRENGYRMALRKITPKHGHEFFVGRGGILIPLSGVLQISEEMYDIGEFQFYQDTAGEAVLRVVPQPGTVPDFADYLDLINRKALGELDVKLELVERIPTTRRGKRRFIEQRLDLGQVGRKLSLAYDVSRVEAR